MAKQKAFFLSPEEIYRKEHPEAFEKKIRQRSSQPKKEKVYNCETCGLSSKCKHPKIKRYGGGEKRILLVGLCPGRTEDKEGIPFIGTSGSFLRKQLDFAGLDINRDCIRTNIVQCFPGLDSQGNDKKPTNNQILSCHSNLLRDIEETKPELIIALGTSAIQELINTKGLASFTVAGTHGLIFPNQKFQTWVGCSYHPSFFCRKKKERGDKKDDIVFTNDLADILAVLGEPLPKPLTKEGNLLITDYKEAIDYMEYIKESRKPSCHDFETNYLSCYEKDSKIFTIALTNEVESAACIPISFLKDGKPVFTEEQLEKVLKSFKGFLASDTPKVVQNYYMEELWGRNILGQSMNNFIHDTMVTAHVINCHRGTTGLGFQAYQLTGHDYKKVVDTRDLQKEPLENVVDYNCWDVRYTILSYYNQEAKLSVDPDKKRFNAWLTDKLRCLANLKDRGILIDTEVMEKLDKEWTEEKNIIKEKLENSPGVKKFESIPDEKGEKRKFNINSGPQLEELIYNIWKEPLTKDRRTSTGRGKTDKDIFTSIIKTTKNKEVKDFVSSLLRYKKCDDIPKKVKEYKRLLDANNRVHPTYNMNVAATYRSSANGPNSQNVFNHDSELQVFRKCIIPRPGNIILEVDYSGMEVRGIAMLSKDTELTRQLIKMGEWEREHPGEKANPWDTHRRWATKIYQKNVEEVTKDERYYSKNGFVFPTIYGSVPSSMVRYEGFSDIPEKHLTKVQEEFWNEYPGIRRWQKEQIQYYNEYGGYVGTFGCKRPGPLNYYQLYNNNNQGMSFLLLLDALQPIDDEMIRRGMESFPFIEIHDSITFDCVPEEMQEVVKLSEEFLLSKRFDWQGDVPLAVEWEASYTDWYSKSAKTFKELMGM